MHGRIPKGREGLRAKSLTVTQIAVAAPPLVPASSDTGWGKRPLMIRTPLSLREVVLLVLTASSVLYAVALGPALEYTSLLDRNRNRMDLSRCVRFSRPLPVESRTLLDPCTVPFHVEIQLCTLVCSFFCL
jgi:hypothetical protein